ncbi:LuxR family transcriptional activator of conjugal transfer of Ti plasmids [Bradyrhizobium sp. LB14.3]|uniref:helix-turn-helix transcriptional regulator n=1 Tax=Bradyrhizobium sp. LB14.3 TaxID=3156328 RepID=UPI003390C0C2
MHRTFQRFVDQLTESTDIHAAQQSMSDITTALNLSCFAYIALPKKQGACPNLISNYPSSWTTRYLRRKYESVDPVIRRAIRQVDPFRWGLGLNPGDQSEAEREFFEEAAEFGIRCGLTFPIHDNSAVAALTFAADARRTDFERSSIKHAQNLRLIAMFFHAHARRFWSPDLFVSGVALSPREFECLGWAAQGKSFKDIGTILGVSRRAVAFHLDNVRAKLGVRSISQAVARLAATRSRR